ncbi:putative 2-hydroxychromene-2-carboxylate isomerase [Aspergillus affinis]|uniref:putative 2-hydroxychromene-2-carboxylate isomerase n=1 Tax=Aspergillus affinis TaxID=1070780 RepID=UPI0022FEB2A8|nr:HCCA isomerase/glutathione S-transferase kappa [Aspergillus affinis]KAI9042710.1 HCCA isomerase/glutathione S-transferase kappa [Aspergillus affinis]
MATPSITLYLDIVSPFSYIAFHVLRNSPVFSQCNITYVPIFLGGLMSACSNTPPVKIKSKTRHDLNSEMTSELTLLGVNSDKDIWINQQRLRWARAFSVPMSERVPEGFPVLTLTTQRALCAISEKRPDQLAPVIEALYRAFWLDRDSKIGQPEGFGPVLEKVLGQAETQDILQAINQTEIKSLLTSNTDQAFKSGAFGLPWFECTNANGQTEGFWGIDHLGQVADFLDLNRQAEQGFRSLL